MTLRSAAQGITPAWYLKGSPSSVYLTTPRSSWYFNEMGHRRSTTETSAPAAVSDRAFGLIAGGILAALGSWRLVLRGESPRPGLLWGAVLLLSAAVLFPTVLHWPKIVWMAVTQRLAKGVNFILLGALFFGVVTPVALFFRATRRDPLRRRFDPALSTYWLKRQQAGESSESMRLQF